MLIVIWLGLVLTALIFGKVNHLLPEVFAAAQAYFFIALKIASTLLFFMAFWLGMMRLAESAGLVKKLSLKLRPIMTWLFPDIPPTHDAMGSMLMNMSVNMLGVANAATPLGLKAMHELQSLSEDKEVASDAMCMFLAVNTSSIQLIPATAIAFLAATGASDPTSIILSAFLATCCSTMVAVALAKLFSSLSKMRRQRKDVKV